MVNDFSANHLNHFNYKNHSSRQSIFREIHIWIERKMLFVFNEIEVKHFVSKNIGANKSAIISAYQNLLTNRLIIKFLTFHIYKPLKMLPHGTAIERNTN